MVALFVVVFLGILVGAAVLMGVGIYNGLISLRKEVDRSWSNIDVILRQRHDEIPQLIRVVEQFAVHEKAILEKLALARSHYLDARDLEGKVKASNEMTHGLRGVFALGEAYPELRSSQHFLQVQKRLSALEETLADRRENFNDTVTNYNTRIEQFPDMFFAQALSYRSLELFKVLETDKVAPSLEIRVAV